MATSSLAAAAAAVPLAGHWADGASPAMLVSAERAGMPGLPGNAVVLDGPRIARLQAMADSLPRFRAPFVLRLDPVDDHFLDVAAQQAGVSVQRLGALPGGLGIRARISRQQRTFA